MFRQLGDDAALVKGIPVIFRQKIAVVIQRIENQGIRIHVWIIAAVYGAVSVGLICCIGSEPVHVCLDILVLLQNVALVSRPENLQRICGPLRGTCLRVCRTLIVCAEKRGGSARALSCVRKSLQVRIDSGIIGFQVIFEIIHLTVNGCVISSVGAAPVRKTCKIPAGPLGESVSNAVSTDCLILEHGLLVKIREESGRCGIVEAENLCQIREGLLLRSRLIHRTRDSCGNDRLYGLFILRCPLRFLLSLGFYGLTDFRRLLVGNVTLIFTCGVRVSRCSLLCAVRAAGRIHIGTILPGSICGGTIRSGGAGSGRRRRSRVIPGRSVFRRFNGAG